MNVCGQSPLKEQLEDKFDEILRIAERPRIYTVEEMQHFTVDGLVTIMERAKEVRCLAYLYRH